MIRTLIAVGTAVAVLTALLLGYAASSAAPFDAGAATLLALGSVWLTSALVTPRPHHREALMPRALTADTLIARGWPPFAARDDLACNPDTAPDFYADDDTGRTYETARRLCARCPVQAACLRWALDTRQAHGMWGGTTPPERAAILRDARSRAALDRLLARPE